MEEGPFFLALFLSESLFDVDGSPEESERRDKEDQQPTYQLDHNYIILYLLDHI